MKSFKGHSGALRTRLLTCGATVALVTACAFTAPAFAQDTSASPADETTTVVVTGIRKGIQDAITAKKKSSQIVEAVSAEDIGKLPDASIAESIARLPGIAAQRTNGRAQTLSVRGLGPDYTVTTLNGREQVSTNDNRSVEFDQYPSELISQVLVYKTPNASMVVQGIAGTADLQTVRPLAYGKRTIAASIRGEMNSEDAAIGGMKNSGGRYSLAYIDQFANKTIGLALGYAHTDSPYQVTKKESWGYPNFDSTHLITGGEKDQVQSSNLTRDGYMGVLEFKPNDHFHTTIDAYHSDFTELQRIARLEFPLAWGANHLQPGYTLGDGYVTHGVFNDVNTVVENYVNERKSKVDSIGWTTEYGLNDNWSLSSDLSYSKISRDDLILETTAGTGASGSGTKDTITFDQTPLGLTELQSVLDYSSFDTIYLTDPGGWGGPGRAGYVKAPHITDELTTIKLGAKRNLNGGIFSSLQFGYNHTKREKNKIGNEGTISLKSGVAVKVPDAFRTGVTDASFLGNTSGMISYDALGLYRSGFYAYAENTCTDCVKKTWNVTEQVDTAFIMANIDTSFMGKALTGNIGVQAQHADQVGTSYFTDGTATGLKQQSGGTNYTDVLPSLSLNWAVGDDMQLRIGAASTISRPRMDELAAGINFSNSTNGNPANVGGQRFWWNGGGGNAELKPWKANAFDLSIEKYFGRKGYVSAAFFYKDLTSYVVDGSTIVDFTGASLKNTTCYDNGSDFSDAHKIIDHDTSSPFNGHWVCEQADLHREGRISSKVNGDGGTIQGLELTASVPGEMIAPWLDGFGIVASAAFNKSAIDPFGSGNIDLPGLSREVINTTVYYEKHGFSARISNRYRGDFLGEVPDYTNTLQNNWVHSESVVDAQMSYQLQSGPAKGLTIYLSGTNLTNEPFYTYNGKGHPERILRYEKYGSTYQFGASYKW